MGRSITPKYSIEYKTNRPASYIAASYDLKFHGKPTDEKAEAIRVHMNDSFKVGVANEHLAGDHIFKVTILHNTGALDGEIAAESSNPMFEVA
jgi:hypothetical protein